MLEQLKIRIAEGLRRKSLIQASKWAENYRVMKGDKPWSFDRHPWLREMHDSQAELSVGQKAAQMGYTETVLNIVFFNMDMNNTDCLYVLPSKTPDASDFSSARFDPALELSPHLNEMFSDVKNVGHKRAGVNNLYIRGAQSASGLRSIPAGILVADEVDIMPASSVALFDERASGQDDYRMWLISTPSIQGTGVNKFYNTTTKEHFHFKCPSCSRTIELIFPESLVVCGDSVSDPDVERSHLICTECKAELPQETKAEWLKEGLWVPQEPGRMARGFYINQLYSCMNAVRPGNIAKKVMAAETNAADEQELYNSKMGLTHSVAGSNVSEEEIVKCQRDHKNKQEKTSSYLRTMGVDVGKVLHVVIADWIIEPGTDILGVHDRSIKRHVAHITTPHFDDLVSLAYEYGINYTIVDANPERRQSIAFCRRLYGRAKMCYYSNGASGKSITVKGENSEPSISVDRTTWLDITLGRYKSGTVQLPVDTDQEFKKHIQAQTRVYAKDKNGNMVGRYVKEDHIGDHYAHADTYCELALPFAFGTTVNSNIIGEI